MEIHEFLDVTKIAYADLRHRMILHSVDFGAELAARAFPDRPEARQIAVDHIVEDVGGPATLSNWLALCDLDRLPRPVRFERLDLDEFVEGERRRQMLADDFLPRAVLDILLLPQSFAPSYGPLTLCILGNAIGPPVVQRILGGPREVAGERRASVVFDPAWCAEAFIHAIFKGIPEVRSIANALKPRYVEGLGYAAVDG